MGELSYFPVYVAKVTSTGLGASKRNIEAETEWLPASAGEIEPAFDGLQKLPPPKVGDYVLVLQADAGSLYRWYLPIRASFPTLSDNGPDLQIESEGKVQINAAQDMELTSDAAINVVSGTTLNIEGGSAVTIGGTAAIEPAVLGTQLQTWLTNLCTQIAAETVVCTAPGTPSTPIVNAPAFAALAGQLATILSTYLKVK